MLFIGLNSNFINFLSFRELIISLLATNNIWQKCEPFLSSALYNKGTLAILQ